uniref:Uncharacterized protein n=1 Tax=Rhinolophus ferrumequinum TaxID=59479 RepID=A0A671DTJ0_RHIFE
TEALAAACTACSARPRRSLRSRLPAPPRPPPRPPPLPGPPPRLLAPHRPRSARHHPPAPPCRRLPLGCWPHSPRPSPGSRRRLPTAEMARYYRLRPPGHYPAYPRGPCGGRTPPTSCRRTLSLPSSVPFSYAQSWEAGAGGGDSGARGPCLSLPGALSPSFCASHFSVEETLPLEFFFGGGVLIG